MTILVNLLAFTVCAAFAFSRNLDGLFHSFDGLYMLVEVLTRTTPIQPLFAFSNDFLQSIGDIQFPQNPRLLFYLWPIWWFGDLDTARIAVYVAVGAIVFMSAYGLARTLTHNQTIALLAGWIVGVIVTPFVPIPFFYPILQVSPSAVLLVATPVIGFWLLHRIGRASYVSDGLAILGLAALVLYLLAAAPGVYVLLAPGAIPYLALAALLATSRAELMRKMAALAIVLLVSIGLRWHLFLLGLFSNTAANIYPADFAAVYHDPIYVSILFHRSVFGWAGPVFVAAAAIGALLSLRRSDGRLRVAAWVLLATLAMLLAGRAALLVAKDWIFPAPIYVEIACWPLYGLFAAVALHRVVGFAIARLPPAPVLAWTRAHAGWLLPIPSALAAAAVAFSQSPGDYAPFPPRLTKTVEALKSEVALTPDLAFAGRVATILPVDANGGDAWVQQYVATLGLWQASGNDLMTIGLWYHQIPTLFQYNQFASPAFHALIKRALQKPPLRHQRNITIFTHPDTRILRLLGVRYVIAPQGDISEAGSTIEETADRRWRRFELSKPNLATYSPTSVEIRTGLTSTLDYVVDDRNDLTKSAVALEDIGDPLVAAHETQLTMSGGDLRVAARSTGRSLVIVPVEYSHCIELRNQGTDTPNGSRPRLIRVNAVLTGVVFDHALDVVLAFRTGPLRNPTCRWEDYVQLRSMLP